LPGEIGKNEFFGLREMLFEDGSEEGCLHKYNYIAKGGEKPTRILAIHGRDFRKVMPASEILKLKK